jgi:hypothetical protein
MGLYFLSFFHVPGMHSVRLMVPEKSGGGISGVDESVWYHRTSGIWRQSAA